MKPGLNFPWLLKSQVQNSLLLSLPLYTTRHSPSGNAIDRDSNVSNELKLVEADLPMLGVSRRTYRGYVCAMNHYDLQRRQTTWVACPVAGCF